MLTVPTVSHVTGCMFTSQLQCEHGWCSADTFAKLGHLTHLALQDSSSPPGQGVASAYFSALPLLQQLSSAGERLVALPAGVADLQHLSVLDLTDNSLTSPPFGGYLAGLRQLSLADNPIQALPPALEAATSLEALDVTRCAALQEYAIVAKAGGSRACCETDNSST